MVKRKTNLLWIAGLTLAIIAIASVAAFAQAPEPIQLAANNTPAATAKPAADLTPSTVLLQARIEAQQQEINRLTAMVEKLQTSLQPIASTQPAWPNGSIGYLPPSGSPSGAPEPVTTSNSTPRELLPDIGHIGAELGFFVGGATNPYKDNTGFATGGFIDLPWKNVPGGKLSYEIMIGLQRATTNNQQTTSGVDALVNTALFNYLNGLGAVNYASVSPAEFLGLNGSSSLINDTVATQERSKVLTVAPFELKYTITKMGRFRPYGVVGLGAYVWIGSENNTQSFASSLNLGPYANLFVNCTVANQSGCSGPTLSQVLTTVLSGSQIGGLAPAASQLTARGVPHGQGNLLFGAQVGGGFEIRVTPKLSMGADFRRNQVEGSNASFNTFAFKQGLHW